MIENVSRRPWGASADAIYDLVGRLTPRESAEKALGSGDLELQLIPCLCALAVYASERGHTCLPLACIAGKSIGGALCLLNSTADTDDTPRGSDFKRVELPPLEILMASIRQHPEIVEEIDVAPRLSDSCPPFVFQRGALSLRRHYQDEKNLVACVRELVESPADDELVRPEGLHDDERTLFPKLVVPQETDTEKAEAAARMLSGRFSILNGGPGTGKTFTIARVLACALKSRPGLRVRLAAPSAKAAARMLQSIGQSRTSLEPLLDRETAESLFEGRPDALTVDKLLGKQPDWVTYKHGEDNPLDADWVIIDEASMLSLPMAVALVQSIPDGCRLTLVGDYNQLPSVDLGHVFADLCGAFPAVVSSLKTSNRFEPNGPVDRLAKAMLGDSAASDVSADAVIALLGSSDIAGIVTWHSIGGDEASDQKSWQIFDECVQRGFAPLVAAGADERAAIAAAGRFCVLSALRHHKRLGCIALNRRIAACLGQSIPTLNLVTANTEDGLHNGDSFVILPNDKETAVFDDGTQGVRRVPLASIPTYERAFAETVHKVQGSEYDNVAIVLSDSADSPLLTREILYTGLTRVKKGGHVDIWSSEDALRKCVKTPTNRFTGLSGEGEVSDNGR